MGGRSGWICLRAATSVACRAPPPPPPPPITRRHCSRCGPSPLPRARRCAAPPRASARASAHRPARARAARASEISAPSLGSVPIDIDIHIKIFRRVLAFQGCRAPPARSARPRGARAPNLGPAERRAFRRRALFAPPIAASAPPAFRRGFRRGAAPRAWFRWADSAAARARAISPGARAHMERSFLWSGRPSERELAGMQPQKGVFRFYGKIL